MTVHLTSHDRVAVVTIDRPERRNALDPATVDALVTSLEAANADPEVHAVVLTGTGDRAFCAGMDLTTVGASAQPEPRKGPSRYLQLLRDGGTKPIVAAVNGAAVAGGFELMLACDLVVAVDHARFALPEVARGLIPGAGGTLLTRRIPRVLANEIALTGAMFSADQALAAGLLNRVVAPADLLPTAIELAAQVAANSPWAVHRTRTLLRAPDDRQAEDLWEQIGAATAEAIAGPDAREGARAFLERRAPVWTSARP